MKNEQLRDIAAQYVARAVVALEQTVHTARIYVADEDCGATMMLEPLGVAAAALQVAMAAAPALRGNESAADEDTLRARIANYENAVARIGCHDSLDCPDNDGSYPGFRRRLCAVKAV